MLPEDELVHRLQDLHADRESDFEMAHVEADKLLCEFLRLIGYDRVGKWYA